MAAMYCPARVLTGQALAQAKFSKNQRASVRIRSKSAGIPNP
jgi:hypothetical protein